MDVNRTLQEFDIPKRLIADLAEVWPQDLSAYLRNAKVAPLKADRIKQAISDVLLVLSVFEVRPDLSSADAVRCLIAEAKKQQEMAQKSAGYSDATARLDD